jgi:hypothetical protein
MARSTWKSLALSATERVLTAFLSAPILKFFAVVAIIEVRLTRKAAAWAPRQLKINFVLSGRRLL